MYRDEDKIAGEASPRDEMLLDVCLEEVLSGQAPPDLSARILTSLSGSPLSAEPQLAEPPLAAPPLAAPPISGPPVSGPPVQVDAEPASNGRARPAVVEPATATGNTFSSTVGASRRSPAARRSTVWRPWLSAAVAASVLIAALGVALLQWMNRRDANPVAVVDEPKPPPSEPAVASGTGAAVEKRTGDRNIAAVESPFDDTLFGAGFPPVPEAPAVPWPLPYAVQPKGDQQIVRFVDEHVRQPHPLAANIDDDGWCRRVFGQILGREPTSEELVDFAGSDAPDKREQLVDRLLTTDEYREEFAQHWAEIWSRELLAADRPGDSTARAGLRQYLADAFRNRKPHDVLASELITATGVGRPGSPQFNGAANFVLAGVEGDKDRSALAATVGRVFLGRQGQCAQCHDAQGYDAMGHDVQGDGLSQQQFWQLAAFFQQADAVHLADGGLRLMDSDYVGPAGDASEAELTFQTPEHERRIAYPVFVDGTRVDPHGAVDVVNRRQELAKLIVGSEQFAAATVDLYWEKLFGKSAAALPESNSPEVRQGLAEQFAAHDFDRRRLLRWLVLSDANSREDTESQDAAPLYDSVASALIDVGRQGRPVTPGDLVLFARIGPAAGVDDAGSIYVPTTGDAEPTSEFVARMNASDLPFAAKVEHVFLQTLARRPTREEAAAAQRMLSSRDATAASAVDDIWWAITNSAEYQSR